MADKAAAPGVALPAGTPWTERLAPSTEVLDFVLPGLLRGTVGALVSPGGVGKSYWALGLALDIAGAGVAPGFSGLSPAAGRVVMLSAEDPEVVMRERLRAYAALCPKGLRLRALDAFDYRTCLGSDIDLLQAEWFAVVRAAAAGARLVILDTLTRFHHLDENSAADMKCLLGALERLAAESGAAVLYLHHTSKAAVTGGMQALAQAARGSSVLTDNARWAAFLAPMSEAEARRYGLEEPQRYVRWNMSKQNYGAPVPDRWYRREAGGALMPVVLKAVPQPQRVAPPATPLELTELQSPPAPASPVLPSASNAFNGNW